MTLILSCNSVSNSWLSIRWGRRRNRKRWRGENYLTLKYMISMKTRRTQLCKERRQSTWANWPRASSQNQVSYSEGKVPRIIRKDPLPPVKRFAINKETQRFLMKVQAWADSNTLMLQMMSPIALTRQKCSRQELRGILLRAVIKLPWFVKAFRYTLKTPSGMRAGLMQRKVGIRVLSVEMSRNTPLAVRKPSVQYSD